MQNSRAVHVEMVSSNKRKMEQEQVESAKKMKSAETQTARRSEFWYEAGNVVIQIDDTHFKLLSWPII